MKELLFEELNKTEKDQIERMIKSQIKDLVNKDLEKIVLDLLKKELKGKDFEGKITDISKEVLVSLYKTLWMRRNFWVTNLGK
jgi:hypothetical protein